jgi:MGT family glycosyltransferase
MRRALFFSLPLHGHTNPSLPLVRELTAQGDEVHYYSTPGFESRVEEAGARYRAYRCGFLNDLSKLPERMEQVAWLLMRAAADVLEQELEACLAERPDYVIADSVAPWGQWIGQVLGVPVVTSITTFAFNRQVLAYAASHGVRPRSARIFASKLRHLFKAVRLMRSMRRRYRVAGPGLMGSLMGRSGLNIVYTSRHFQPCADSFPASYHFTGPSISERREPVGFPWEDVRHSRIVYVSLGTLFNTDAGFYQRAIAALKDEDAQIILSAGGDVPLGTLPPNVIARPYVPQLDVLRRASAFVTHGGMNSVSESLSFGVPIVVVPQMSEQEIVGHRVEELGCGLYLSKSEATVDALRTSVRQLMADERFRRSAGVIRDSFIGAGGVSRAADAILKYTR